MPTSAVAASTRWRRRRAEVVALRIFLLGLAVAVVIFNVDQFVKIKLIDHVQAAGGYIEVTPFFNLVMVWNRGISFGMFQTGDTGRWVLIALTGAIAVGLLVWLWRVQTRLLACALGAVIGGAVGNIVDRVVYGAVADFFDFHVAGYHWPAFNVADSAIVVGVAIMLLDSLFAKDDAHK